MTPTTNDDCAERQSLIEALARQNDTFRTSYPPTTTTGTWVHTAAVSDMGAAFVMKAYAALVQFDGFTEDMDPYGERSMGALSVEGETVWFKIDYFDPDYQHGSEDPSDPSQTRRVLTLMFPSDY